jgi:glycosyltransferase involved in cell wall biosynthesis
MPRPPGVLRLAVLFEAAFADPAPWGMYPALTQRQWIRVTARNLRGAVAVVCLSEHGRDDIVRNFGVAPDRLLLGPPSLRPFPRVDRSRYRPANPYVLVVGWFHPRKDVMLALAAWRSAVERGLDADLVLAGAEGPADHRHGAMGRRILDAVGRDLARRVHFTGLIPRGELGALYRHASALLMTSQQEGFGMPAIEAFSLGVPVVAAARTSLTEVVAPAGSVVAPEPDALGDALVDVCARPPDGDKLRAYAASFTPERQVAPVLAVADRLATS